MTRPWIAGIPALLIGMLGVAHAQAPAGKDELPAAPLEYAGGMPPVMDTPIIAHALLDQFEDRFDGSKHSFRYDGQAWAGTDYNKLWLKSEGRVLSNGRFTDGQHEALYDRAISTFFDLQTGVRFDVDSGPSRTWGAFGIQGLAPLFFDLEATAYVSDQGHLGARITGSYDLLITQRLILQPQAELNFYSKADPGRGTGPGLSEIDTGLRLRYEITRKFAPYIGVAYQGLYGQTARFAQREGESTSDLRFVFGARVWF
jgi:copper resistance protein B